VYTLIFGAGAYYLVRVVRRGLPDRMPEAHTSGRPARPLSAATEDAGS
jgi:hypothetical protein